MERSGSQKALLVLSIIEIVLAAIAFIGGALIALGGGLIGASPTDAGMTASEAGAVGGVAVVLGVVLIVSAVISLLCGIFGIRAANDANKVMPVWVLTLIELIICVISLIWAIVDGSFGSQASTLIISAAFSLIMFLIANSIRNQRTLQ